MQTLFVTGTDTGVGKTWVSCLIIRRLRENGVRVGAYKPVCSGASADSSGRLTWNDVESLRLACGTGPPVELVCPQRFSAPVAPNVAAHLQGTSVDDRLLSTGLDEWRSRADWLVVEGAGGAYCPLSDVRTVLDLAADLNGPVVVVAANRLGVISHTRLTVTALRSAGLSVAAVILNDANAPNDNVAAGTNAEQLMRWLPGVPLYHCAWQAEALAAISKSHDGCLEDLFASMVTRPANPS